MERTIKYQGKDYSSNSAKVIVNSKWKSCLKKPRKLSKVQEPSNRQDFLRVSATPRAVDPLPARDTVFVLHLLKRLLRIFEERGDEASCRCCPCNADKIGVALVATS